MDLYRSGGKSSATDADARPYEETEDFVQQHLMKNRLFGDW